MNDLQEVERLRELLMSAPEATATRVIAAVLGLSLLVVVLWLVRRRALREEYTPIWLLAAIGLAFVSLRLDVLRTITEWIGAWTPSSTVFFLGELFLLGIALHYAVRLSRANLDIKNLSQETALLRARLERLESRTSAG